VARLEEITYEAGRRKVRLMSWLSGSLSILMIAQTLAWLAALTVE
jgi:hypothetical protein